MKTYKLYDINWDVDNKKDLKTLPKQHIIKVDENFSVEYDGADILSDTFGFCVNGFKFKEMKNKKESK